MTRWSELESIYCVTSISARNTSTWAFFSNAVFNHFQLEDFSQTNGNLLVGVPKAHFRQKSKSTNSPNFSGLVIQLVSRSFLALAVFLYKAKVRLIKVIFEVFVAIQ